MLVVQPQKNKVAISIEDCNAFDSVKAILKLHKFVYSDSTKLWSANVLAFDEARTQLEDFDIIKIVDEAALQELRRGKQELVINPIRVLPDYTLLNYPPVVGKHPYENYQKIDIAAGLSRNRYAYFLGMGCLTGDTVVTCRRASDTFKISLEDMYKKFNGLWTGLARSWNRDLTTYVRSLLGDHFGPNEVEAVTYSGRKLVYRLTLASGKSLKLTADHRVLTPGDVWMQLRELKVGDMVLTVAEHMAIPKAGPQLHTNFIKDGNEVVMIPPREDVIAGIEELGAEDTYDITCKDPYHNFVANGIVVHNSGKTYIFSALIAHYYKAWHKVNRILIITSSIGVRNIYHELFKFIKDLTPAEVRIADLNYREIFSDDKTPPNIILMNYNTWRIVCNAYKKKLKIEATKPRKPFVPIEDWLDGDPGMLILDESHLAAIPSAQQSHLLALHAPCFEYRYLFSGTPADKPEKQYNQFKILDSYLVHNLCYTDWLAEYAEVGTRFSPYDVREWKYNKLEELNKQFTSQYGIYRESKDIIELPVHYEKRVYVRMSLKHRRIYEEFIQTSMDEYTTSGDCETKSIVNRFAYLMLASENPVLLEKHLDKFGDRLASRILDFRAEDAEKLNTLEDILEEHSNEQGVVWITHPITAAQIADRFAKYKPLVIVGETPQDERNAILAEFENNKEHRILIANIKVLNTSVNITWATWQCYVERIFDYAPYEQSTKRIYRIGQTQPVTTYILLYEDSLDILQDKNLTTKGKLVSSLVSKDFLTREEWVKIFNCKEEDEF